MRILSASYMSGLGSLTSHDLHIREFIRKRLMILNRYPFLVWILKGFLLLTLMKMVMVAWVLLMPVFLEITIPGKMDHANSPVLVSTELIQSEKAILNQRIRAYERKLGRMTPVRPYLVINTTLNRFYLYAGRSMIREGVCSTGSYVRLEADDGKTWMFRTPRGKFRIQAKTEDPVWIKPDWAFIEEGLPVPPENYRSRFEYGVLGDYALSLGDGYLIHGTLYQRFLGMPVTHGCVRLNDSDLEEIYHILEVGSRVYIY